MSWMICNTQSRGDPAIQNELEEAFVAIGWPADLALFCRTSDDFETEIYLISPAVSKTFPMWLQRRNWVEEPNWQSHKWIALLTNCDPKERFGIQLGTY